ncbi:coiled-coil domain-containing protein [Fusibacter tunisiensis]|uniref:Outer membrane murein-binding lipoprotein Lpp n=1 Tax=Fusibacter tunisiensis TaxID=1008308 RepID=A0ABS2MPX1_9FIRM|nr:hypothetical protein [Fusibacter tunisiensis]MBM7561439.1 outer membrane murein-binding lipoprotein Lpp [Fusibacter tunisiensis]
MKRIILILLVVSLSLFGCEATEKKDAETSELNSKIETLNNEIIGLNVKIESLESNKNEINQTLEEQDAEIESLQYNVAVGRGFAVQYMFDMNTLYEELNCPVYIATDEKELLIIEKLLERLEEDSLFSNRKIVTLRLSKMDDNDDSKYLVNGIAFTPEEQEELTNTIESGSSIPYPAIKGYSIRLILNDGDFEYEILQ